MSNTATANELYNKTMSDVPVESKNIFEDGLKAYIKNVEENPVFLVTAEGLYESERPETRTFAGTQGIAKDVTELKETRSRLSRQNRFLVRILEALPYPFYVINVSDYSISFANTAAQSYRLSKQATCYALTHQRGTPCESAGQSCPIAAAP